MDAKRFLVLGLGGSGRAVARLLALEGLEVSVTDDDESVASSALGSAELAPLAGRVEAVAGESARRKLESAEALIVSPGVPLGHPLVRTARAMGIIVTGEIEVAYRRFSSPIIAVTGTNGKSTVVNLTGKILETAGKKTVVAGNIGTPFAAVVEKKDPLDVVVLEISSFQLDTIIDFHADVAVLTNVTVDHLDRYEDSFDLYAESKARILNRAGSKSVFVYNADDAVCVRIADGFDGFKIPFSSSRSLSEGVFFENGLIVRRLSGSSERIAERGDFPPIGVHNLENAMAAVAAVTPFGVPTSHILKAFRAYRPLSHRMEPVRTLRGVVYIDDSKATNVDATVKSLRSVEGKIVVILGGSDKNLDFRPLADHAGRLRRAILIGQARGRIRAVLEGRCELSEASSLEEAVREASQAARPGDTVLLAPACASFDMFRNYAHRGEVFRRAVEALGETS
jgi:UDP-N-acetylmuramoylalanine--D-glutamate ligase